MAVLTRTIVYTRSMPSAPVAIVESLATALLVRLAGISGWGLPIHASPSG